MSEHNETVLISGATSGIGLALAREFARLFDRKIVRKVFAAVSKPQMKI